MTFRKLKTKRRERGQVLIMAVMCLVILLIFVLILSDLQRIIRGKMTVMSGVDAAALTGATWQKHTLNVIGELNLIKACTVMITDPTYGIGSNTDDFMKLNVNENSSRRKIRREIRKVKRQLEKLEDAENMLTEIQVRAAFVLPLIGFGAAQQAAKANHMPANDDCNEYLKTLLEYVNDDDIYGNEDIAPQNYYGYAWRTPYADMLTTLLGQDEKGIAVGTNLEHIGMPKLDSTTMQGRALRHKIIMDAIAGNDWCILTALLKRGITYSGKWWGEITIEKKKDFLGSSEILPIHITHYTGEGVYTAAENSGVLARYANANEQKMQTLAGRNKAYNYTNALKDNKKEIDWEDSDLKLNPLPSITWAIFNEDNWMAYSNQDEWKGYLKGDFKTGTDYYSGALSYFSVRVPNRSKLGEYKYSGIKLGKKGLQNVSDNSYGIRFNATAKPFGNLKDESGKISYPFIAGMVLPVFEKVVLIPVALEPAGGVAMEDYAWMIFLTKCLPALGTVDSIDALESVMEAKHYTIVKNAGYIACLKKLDNPVWREKGIQWLDTIVYKKERVKTGEDFYGDPIYDWKLVPDGTNRDHCNKWIQGSGTVSHKGPGTLH